MNGLLTNLGGMLFLIGSLDATLLDREAKQQLFDNRYDVPESVRPIFIGNPSELRARVGL